MSGRVTFRTSLQPSWPSKSSNDGSLACSIVPMAPSATTTLSARARRRAAAEFDTPAEEDIAGESTGDLTTYADSDRQVNPEVPARGEVAHGDRARRLP